MLSGLPGQGTAELAGWKASPAEAPLVLWSYFMIEHDTWATGAL